MREGAPQSVLLSAMWAYAAGVLSPALEFRSLTGPPKASGDLPVDVTGEGLGPQFSRPPRPPELDPEVGEHDHLVAEFHGMAEVYDSYVRPFSVPIFSAALDVLTPFLPDDARVLDAGCGPGRQLVRVSRLVPRGEVVGVDLAGGMVEAAYAAARAAGCDNTAFVQADVGRLPPSFSGAFDFVYNCLAHHHFPKPEAAAAEALRCLRPGGLYAVIDPGPGWYNLLAAPLAKWADPGWIGFQTPRQHRDLMKGAGFARVSWFDLLPGIVLVLGQRGRH